MRNENTRSEEVLLFCSINYNFQYGYIPTFYYSKLFGNQIDFPSVKKTIKYYSLIITCPVDNGNSEG